MKIKKRVCKIFDPIVQSKAGMVIMLVIPLIKIDDLPINVFDWFDCNKGIHYS